MTTRTQHYHDTGLEFLAGARAHFEEGDLLQASEKGWGAAAQMVKCAAEERGWPQNNHRDLFRSITRLVEETGDEDLRTAFNAAGSLHTHFYEGWLDRETVAANLDRVAELVAKLDGQND